MFTGLPASISIGNYFIGVLMVYLVVLFVLALTILLGVLFDRIAAVTALALTIFFSGSSIQSNSQIRWLEPYTVWALQHNSYETMTGKFPSTGWLAISSAIISIAVILTIAIIWMQRSDLGDRG
ncbi:hypothetical protein [Chamaesiphon polymorphus]|uniref:ABC transporter permease n=1 Tax=Chamaesiphon polymorphus CCALA 037 TaxID=2107692 RepID=A0A2T1GLQ9_9CYAN|nr:hypothetical protein [Chamaesiphon polymorphus]PSB58825.1 hypothetical protein C7B77_03165 [Chamaesiphon polymorphus CCALA 037]